MKLYWILAFVLCTASVPASAEPVEFGAALCLTGACAEWGDSALKGVRLAIGEINEAGGLMGRPIELVAEDTAEAASGNVAITAFQRLTSRNIHFIIGPSWSPAGLALIPILSKTPGVIVITPSMAVPDFSRAADNLFKTVPDNSTTAERIAEYAIEKGYKRCAVISNQLQAERYTAEVFTRLYEKLGGKVVTVVETAPDEQDLRTHALKLLQSNPEVIFLGNYLQLGPTAKRLRELGYKGPFISYLIDRTRIGDGAGALEGTVFSRYVSFSAEFDEKFRARYGEPPGPSADSAYDTVFVLAEAIRRTGSFDPFEIKKALPDIAIRGTATPIEFDEFRTVDKPSLLFEVRGRDVVQLQ